MLFLLLVFLILWFCYLTAVAPEQEEGVEVEFAEIEEEDEPYEPSLSAYAQEPSEASPAAPASPAPEVATDPKPASPPEHIVSEEETLALERARNIAAPINTARLGCDTPCRLDGVCHNCNSPQCICNYVHFTRNSFPAHRHTVILVGENWGY